MVLQKHARWLATLAALLLSGCATFNPNAGFSDVSAAVAERTGVELSWNKGTKPDREAMEKVSALLKEKLSAAGAVQIALLNNRDLQATYADLGVAQADLVQAGLLQNPIFNGALLFPLSGGGRPDLELSVVMNFLEVFYRPLKKRIAAARFEEAKLGVTGAALDLAWQVQVAFYRHLANEQLLEMRETIAQALDASLDITKRLHVAGNVADLHLARERALTEKARLELRAAEIALRQTREQLNSLLGLWGKDTEWQTEGRLPDIPQVPRPPDYIERLAIIRSIDLARARQRIMAAGEQLGVAEATAFVPESHLGAIGEREEVWALGPALELPLPLADQGQGRTGLAAVELRRSQQEYFALAVRIRAAARALRDSLLGVADRALYYRDIMLPLQERILNETQLHYNAMQVGVLDLLRAKEQQIETAVAYVETLRDYWLTRSDLDLLLHGRMPEGEGALPGATDGQTKGALRGGHPVTGH